MMLRLILTALVLGLLAGRGFGEIQAGAAKVEITPATGVSLDGPISKNGPVTSVHDPLHARALVLDDGNTKLAIVVVDQCMTGREVFDAAKAKIQTAIQLPANRMLMAATHTHAAPRTEHISREPIDDAYHRRVADGICQAVLTANERLAPAEVGYASFNSPEFLACRRFLCEPGSVEMNPFGVANERIKSVSGRSSAVIEPAGPTDPQFSILAIRHTDGTPLCLLGNFSVHYCGGYQRGAVSADYFGYFSAAVESGWARASQTAGRQHPPVVGIMSNGTSGNTGSFQSTDGRKFAAFEGMEFYGRLLAERAVAALAATKFSNRLPLAMREHEIELGVRRPDSDRIEWAHHVLESKDTKFAHPWTRVYAQETLHLAEYPPHNSIKLQAIRIGEIGIAAAPCEVFAETGLVLKQESPLRHTFTMELANGYGGYLPTRAQHALGGYETWPARSSFLEVDAEEKIRGQLIQLLTEVSEH